MGPDGSFGFPAIVSAPGSGQMYVTAVDRDDVTSTLVGSREQRWVDWTIGIPVRAGDVKGITLRFRPLLLAPPAGLKDLARWKAVRRAWFNVFQPTASWGGNDPRAVPSGVLGNNVLSDPVSCCLFFYADLALFTPEFAAGVSSIGLVSRTLDWWLSDRMLPTGEVYGYWKLDHFLDANPSILITAWDCASRPATARGSPPGSRSSSGSASSSPAATSTTTGSSRPSRPATRSRSGSRPGRARRGTRSTAGTRTRTATRSRTGRSGAWRTSSRDSTASRRPPGTRSSPTASRPRSPGRSSTPRRACSSGGGARDGGVHDLYAPFVNALAVEYGLVDPQTGRAIMQKLNAKMAEAGFTRFDLGVPITLVPVPKGDYFVTDVPGFGARETKTAATRSASTSTAASTTGEAVRYYAALHTVGESATADRMLDAMLARLAKGDFDAGGFPVNIVDQIKMGGEFLTWDGKPCGYEGLLSHAWHWVSAVAIREPELRARLHRPLQQP